jgi:TolA-binding protein
MYFIKHFVRDFTETHHHKMRVAELTKANSDHKVRAATLSEQVDNLNRNIVPSPQKLQQEIQEQKNRLVTEQHDKENVRATIEETTQIAAQVREMVNEI